jgi:hypothetical protein
VVDKRGPRVAVSSGRNRYPGSVGSFERGSEFLGSRVKQLGRGREGFADTLAKQRDLGVVGGVLADIEVGCPVVG